MIQIRQGVFETNSSSTHAISICEYHSDVKLPEVVKFETNQDFGWEFEDYTDVYSKANYLWLAICYKYDKLEQEDELLNAKATLTQYLASIGVRAEFEELEYIESHWTPESRYLDMKGYIDHPGALYEMVGALLEDPKLLYGYLFNDHSMVSTGNDNDDRGVNYAYDAIFSVYKGN
jgi:hypothetical protein